jgi:hypothetical protein
MMKPLSSRERIGKWPSDGPTGGGGGVEFVLELKEKMLHNLPGTRRTHSWLGVRGRSIG